MKLVAEQCKICGKTLTPEEVDVGMPLVCLEVKKGDVKRRLSQALEAV